MNNLRLLQRTIGAEFSRKKFFCKRNHSSGAYEGDGKTTVTILNQQMDAGLMINSFSQIGFRLNNGLTVVGPMAIFPRTVVSWNVDGLQDVNEDSLSLFFTLDPKIDILVLGLGDEKVSPAIYINILQQVRKFKMNVEILPTEQACATFNFLNGEGRCVAGALIPPANIRVTENDMLQSKLRYQNLYLEED